MSVDAAEALIARILGAGSWPLEPAYMAELNTWAALREHDHDALKRVRGWDSRSHYRIDPLAEVISDRWASYLFGEEPQTRPAQDGDAELMAELLEVNAWASELERAAGLCSSEGEIWGRIYVDELVAPRPLLDWISRRNIVPLWVGPRLAAAAVETELPRPAGAAKNAVYRHFEVHAPGVVLNLLAVGTNDKIGVRRGLDEHPETEPLDEVWTHGLPRMLLERIPNRLRGRRDRGISDYKGILDYLLDLNEAVSIGAHNMRLTARKRAVISAAIAQQYAAATADLPVANGNGTENVPRARFDPAEEIFIEDPLDGELGKTTTPLRVLEYDFDAEALIAWKRELVESAVTRAGLTPQYAGTNASDGYAISGTALRLRLIPTDATGKAKGRYWDGALPRILATMAQLDGAPVRAVGFGRQWEDATTPPTLTRRPGIPPDEVEDAQRHSTLVNAGLESIETGVRALHPEWNDERVDEEVARIREDRAAGAGAMMAPGF